jgi:stage III sporulation protein AG
MLKEQMDKLKEAFNNNDGNNKKKIENLVVFIVILIITIIVINSILGNDENENSENISAEKVLAQEETNTELTDNNDLEERLEEILSNIQGVGSVKVLITYSESSQTIAMYNEDNSTSDTEETDSRWRK